MGTNHNHIAWWIFSRSHPDPSIYFYHSSKFSHAPLWLVLPPELITVLAYGNHISIVPKIPASNSSRYKYTCSTKTKQSRDKNNTFSSVGDPVIPPNWHLSWTECERERQICCPFCRSLLLWLFRVWASCATEFLIFIDFDYHTTRPPNPGQLFLLAFNLRN